MIVQLLRREDEGYPRVSTPVLLAFCGYVLIWYLQIGYRIPLLGAIRIEFIWALALTAIALLSSNRPKLMDNPLSGVVILLFLAMAIQVPFSHAPQHSWNVFFDRVIKFAFMAFFIVSFIRSPKGLILFIGAFMLACMKMGQEGLVGQITGSLVWQNQGVMRLHGSTPMYVHPNSFTGMALGTIPFIVYLFPIAPKIVKIFLGIQFVLACNIILHTGSRTGYIAFFIMLAFVFFRSKKKMAVLLAFSLCSLVAAQYIDQQYVDRFMTIFSGQDIEGNSIDAREQIIKDAMEIFREHPLGVGVAAFPAVRNATFGRSQDTHNLYLEIATNIGIQGLVIFMVFVYKMLKMLRNISKESIELIKRLRIQQIGEHSEEKIRIENILCDLKLINIISKSVCLFLLVRLTLGLFGMDLYEIYWWFSVGLCIAIFYIHNEVVKKVTSARSNLNINCSNNIYTNI